nr:MAG TPA: hypothetical protein [Caudoviricetes sp.]
MSIHDNNSGKQKAVASLPHQEMKAAVRSAVHA